MKIENEWIDIKNDLPDGPGCIVNVKSKNSEVKKACYHRDGMIWLSYYTKDRLSRFQCFDTLRFMHDVTHWMPLPKPPEE